MQSDGLAYGKINLGLRIHGRRPDGFHEIETIFHRINLADELRFEPADGISIECSHPAVPTDERNLCIRATMLLQQATGVTAGVRMTLTKNIPVGAGLGGGSADAALVLRMLPAIWASRVSPETTLSIAAELGSDVPFFLGRQSAHGRGRGEVLEYHAVSLPFTVVVCFPGTVVSTAHAYSLVRHFKERPAGRLWHDFDQFLRSETGCEPLENDFEPVLFRAFPEIRQLKELMLTNGARCASLSGSGSAVYGLFEHPDRAAETAQRLARTYAQVHVTPHNFKIPDGV